MDQLHSVFASIAGSSFTILAIATSFILKNKKARILAIVIGVLANLLSYMMFHFEDYMGIFQRIIFITSYGWMLTVFRKATP